MNHHRSEEKGAGGLSCGAEQNGRLGTLGLLPGWSQVEGRVMVVVELT